MTHLDPDRLDPEIESALDQQFADASDEALLARVKSRVMTAIAAQPQHVTVRAGEGPWQTIAPGVERKLLWRTGEAMACMLRCAPGARLPAHDHPTDEECVVLEGSMSIAPDIELRAGDFHLARQGTCHGVAETATGCLVYLRGAVEASGS